MSSHKTQIQRLTRNMRVLERQQLDQGYSRRRGVEIDRVRWALTQATKAAMAANVRPWHIKEWMDFA